MKKKVLLTGGSGFLGRNIIRELGHNKEFAITNLSRSPSHEPGVADIICDAQSFEFKTLAGESFDYIIHTLALSNEKFCSSFEYANDINVAFTQRLLDFSSQNKKLKKFIHISSTAIYDPNNRSPVRETDTIDLPRNTYIFTKGISEAYVEFYRKKFGLPSIVFRLSNIYGPYQSFRDSPFLVPRAITQALRGEDIEVMNLSVRRDWIYSQDASVAIGKALESEFEGILNLGSGIGIPIEDMIKEIAIQTGVGYHSSDVAMPGADTFYCEISAIKEKLHWHPDTALSVGIKNTIDYARRIDQQKD